MTVQVITSNSVAVNGTDTSGGPFGGDSSGGGFENATTTPAGTTDLYCANTSNNTNAFFWIKSPLTNIPGGQIIFDAKIWFVVFGGNLSTDAICTAYNCNATAAEGLTWDTKDGTNNWPAGAGAIGADITTLGTTATILQAALGVANYYSIDVTAWAQSVYGGATNNGLIFKRTNGPENTYFLARGRAYTDLLRPELVVTYAGGALPVETAQHRVVNTSVHRGATFRERLVEHGRHGLLVPQWV